MTGTVGTDFKNFTPHGLIARDGDLAGAQIDRCIAQHRQLQFEVAHYIELLLGELGVMARAADLKHLLYFLEMTRQEAGDQARRCQPER